MGPAEIADEVRAILDLPIPRHKNQLSDTAYRTTNAVFKAIVIGLKRDGRVRVEGFGTFKVVKIKAKRKCIHYYFGEHRGTQRESVIVPEHFVVKFYPHGSFIRYINADPLS